MTYNICLYTVEGPIESILREGRATTIPFTQCQQYWSTYVSRSSHTCTTGAYPCVSQNLKGPILSISVVHFTS